jgi:hypothetical protein
MVLTVKCITGAVKMTVTFSQSEEWVKNGVMTQFGKAKVYTTCHDGMSGEVSFATAFLEDRSRVFYTAGIGWETEEVHLAREAEEKAARKGRRRRSVRR